MDNKIENINNYIINLFFIKRSMLYFFFFLASLCVYTQNKNTFNKNLNFKNISTKDGLSQRSVISILQDNEGFLWFGTRYGLNKYDGVNFKVYNYNSEDENSLSHNRITEITLDNQGQIWVGTMKGLNLYNRKEDNFIRIKKYSNTLEYYTNTIKDIAPIDSTFMWVATDVGVDKLNTKTLETLSITSNNVLSIVDDKESALWICTEKNIEVYNYKLNVFKTFKYPENSSPHAVTNSVVELYKDKDHNIWLGYHGGLAFFNPITKRFEDYLVNSKKIIDNPVRTICQDKEGVFWIGSYSGLYRFNHEIKTIFKYENDVNNSNSLSQNSIYSILEDARGDLWIGTWAGGIDYLDRNSSHFFTLTAGIGNRHLNYKVVSSIVEDAHQNLWIGTEGGGLNFYNTKDQKFTYYKGESNDIGGLTSNNVKDIIKDYQGNLWVGTHGGGLNYINIKEDHSKNIQYQSFYRDSRALSDNKITALIEDSKHNLWIGTNEGGLNFFNTKTKKFTKIPDPNNIIGTFVYTIEKSMDNNTIYVGSSNGLAKIDIDKKIIESVNYRDKPQGPFSVNQVISIYETSNNNLWVGTEGDGLYKYNLITKKSTSYGLKDGLPNEVVYAILPDDNNNIWVSTNKGISRINRDTKQIKTFDKIDGLQGNEFNYGASLKTKNGELIFGGSNGVTIFNPDNIIDNDSYMPPIHISGFKVRNKPYLKSVESFDKIELAHNQNDFSFDFVALGYSNSKKNLYAYKLDGFDSDWNYIGNKQTATYTNINPGNYKFYVKASNSNGVWGNVTKGVTLHIKKPFWATWLAYFIYVSLLLAIALTIRKYNLLRVKDRNQLKQERLDREHIEEVNRLKLQLFTNISHDFRTPLTLIIGPLKRLIDKNKADEGLQKQLSGMYRNATILLQLINQLLDFRKSESGKLKLMATKRNIVPFLENIKLSFEELANNRSIDYTFVSDNKFYEVWFDEIEMKKVVLNVLSNAFKFTPSKGEISLHISTDDNLVLESKQLKIIIKDNGKGIREEDLPHIFDRFFQLGQHHELRSGTGVGLALAKDIVLLHKGQILVESEQGKGTQFTILLPLGKTHLSKKEMIVNEELLDGFTNNLDYYDPAVMNLGWVGEESKTQEVFIKDGLSSILLVEDNDEVRSFVKGIFEGLYNVFEAKNGEEGIHIAQSLSVDLIISDVMMPKMDGLELCHQIKTNIKTSHIPVLLLTARTSSKVQSQGYKIGADVYLTKPFDAQTLKLQVQNILKSRRLLIEKFKKDILLEPKEITVVSTDEVFLKKAMEIIEENVSNSEFNVNKFCEDLAMSRTVVYKKVKVLTGQSISEFIRTIRLKKASQLLRNTDMSISEIVYDVGFNDIKYFRKCFKTAFNQTPSLHRKFSKQNEVV
ncbi:two-component regulator propeller domain-containing protein [Postechiella marina]|uniref:histidine kinase n=1 Tax=Postechiella marina TaxID=943941 RepID=A0ABP8C3P7_9FLAO